jgi:hypothetical protein
LGRKQKGPLFLDVYAAGAYGARLRLWLAGVLVEDEAGSHIDVDRPSARAHEHSCFLAIVGTKLVSFDITETDEMDLDLEATGRSRRVFVDRRGRIIAREPAFSRVDGTAHGTIFGSVRVYTRGAYARYALKFFDATWTAKNLAADENYVLLRPGDGAWVEIEPVSMYLYLMAPPYRRLLARVVAPREHREFVMEDDPV